MKLRELERLAEAAVRAEDFDGAEQVAHHILDFYPEHATAHAILGQVYIGHKRFEEAAIAFEQVLAADPESVVAHGGLAVVARERGNRARALEEMTAAWELRPESDDLRLGARDLSGEKGSGTRSQLVLGPGGLGRLLQARGCHEEAAQYLQRALALKPLRLDLKVALTEALWRANRPIEAEQAAKDVLALVPGCLKALVIMSQLAAARVDMEAARRYLTQARPCDPTGELTAALFGPTNLTLALDLGEPTIPEPAVLTDLRKGAEATVRSKQSMLPRKLPADLEKMVQEVVAKRGAPRVELSPAPEPPRVRVNPSKRKAERVPWQIPNPVRLLEALKPRLRAAEADESSLQPAALIVSSRKRLSQKYGGEWFGRFHKKLCQLAEIYTAEKLASYVLYVDDPRCVQPFDLQTVNPGDAQAVKGLIDAVDTRLGLEGMRIEYLLLVGGDDIIPFHRLPNPTEDQDLQVCSDNLYGGAGSNCLGPERAVGRLPDSVRPDPVLFETALATAITERDRPRRPTLSIASMLGRGPHSLGYTAMPWQEASESVYRAVTRNKGLSISPPLNDDEFDLTYLDSARFAYFNLHGAEETPNWYGERDTWTEGDSTPIFPIALTPSTVSQVDVSRAVVFTEACYGAHLLGRSTEDSIALQFLGSGAVVVVGSTQTSYGTSAPPLCGADLLAYLFLARVRQGQPFGRALVEAKSAFVAETLARQDYLDGDDQKTVIEFVLYGDPTLTMERTSLTQPPLTPPRVSPIEVCANMHLAKGTDVPEQMLKRAKAYLEEHFPAQRGGELSCALVERDGALVSARRKGTKGNPAAARQAFAITSRKTLRAADGAALRQVVRLTVDDQGEVQKTAVSR